MATYSEEQKQNALNLYLKDASVTRIEQMTGITRATLHTWMKKGELTDGDPWQMYRDKLRAEQLQATRRAELQAVVDGERKYLDQVKHDLREIVYENVIAKFRAGEFDVKVGDLTEIVKLYNQLENGAAEKIAFAEYFAGKVLEIVYDIIDEKQYVELRQKLESYQTEIEAKLNPLSIAHQVVV